MAKIESYKVMDFSGGIHRDKSLFELQKNELLDARNVEIDDKGRIQVRRGSFQFGQTGGIDPIDSHFVFARRKAGVAPAISMIRGTRNSGALMQKLVSTRLTANLTTTSTEIDVVSITGFTAGTCEIDGDLIAFTGSAGTQLTGVTGITSSHTAGTTVNQWIDLSPATALNSVSGLYYAVLNNICFVNGYGAVWQQIANDDATTMTNLTEPAGLFVTNYRVRLWCAGDGSTFAGTGSSGSPIRINWSAYQDGTTWSGADTGYIDIEDQRQEFISSLLNYGDVLRIFKPNSLWSYDQIEAKLRIDGVGAYNQRVIKEINSFIYTFCPEGIFKTNGYSATQIGLPVKQYWKNFQPRYDTLKRVILNTFAGVFGDHYLLYIGNITDPTTTSDVVLDYDTKSGKWVVHTGLTNFVSFDSFRQFKYGDSSPQFYPVLFAGNSSGQSFKMFENRYVDGQTTPVNQGGDIFQDLVSNTGAIVSAVFETPMYDLTHPELYKSFRHFRGYSERGQWMIDYRVENEDGITEYKPLGAIWKTNQVIDFPSEAQGWRIGFKGTAANAQHNPIFNGFVLEDTIVVPRY